MNTRIDPWDGKTTVLVLAAPGEVRLRLNETDVIESGLRVAHALLFESLGTRSG